MSQQATPAPPPPSLHVVGGSTTQPPAPTFNAQLLPQPLARPVAAAQPFPMDALGPVVEQTARAIVEFVQAPEAICAQSVLAACAFAAQQQVDVVLPTGATRPASLYFLTVGASGERKSAVDDLATKPLAQYQKNLHQQHRAELAAFEAARKGDDPTMERPLMPTVLVGEPTFEGLCRLLAEGQANVALMSDEGGAFLNGHAMSAENKLRTATGLCSLWDGKPLSRPRASQSTETLYGRRAGLHLMVQPDIARTLTGDAALRDQGLLSRVLVSAPDTRQGRRLWQPPSQQARTLMASYTSHLGQLLAEPLPLECGERNVLAPRPVRLGADAERAFVAFYNDVEREVGHGGRLAPIAGLANKAPEHASRMALVQAYIANPYAAEIDEDAFDRAVVLMKHYLDEALRLTALGPVSADVMTAQTTLDWLIKRGKGLFMLTEVYQCGPTLVRTSAEARKALTVLQAHHWVIREPKGTKVNGISRNDVFRLNLPGLPDC